MTLGSNRLGNEQLGERQEGEEEPPYSDEIQALIQTIEPSGPDSSRERLESHLKPVFDPNDRIWDGLLETLSTEFEEFVEARNDVFLASFVDTATGDDLEHIGEIVQLPRKTGESDEHYRGRLKVHLRRMIGGGTIRDIKTTSAILLDTEQSEIVVDEDFSIEPARFMIEVQDQLFADANVTTDDFVELINQVKAAGVRAIATTRGSFEHRSAEDYQNGVTNPDRGYDGLDSDGARLGIGGRYRSLL